MPLRRISAALGSSQKPSAWLCASSAAIVCCLFSMSKVSVQGLDALHEFVYLLGGNHWGQM
jgi:hypothetical protein